MSISKLIEEREAEFDKKFGRFGKDKMFAEHKEFVQASILAVLRGLREEVETKHNEYNLKIANELPGSAEKMAAIGMAGGTKIALNIIDSALPDLEERK